MIESGDLAPDFELPDQDGRAAKLADFRGQRVVLYFYPKAERKASNTHKEHAAALAICRESVEALKAFHEQHGADVPLLADADGTVAGTYGVGQESVAVVVDPGGAVAGVVTSPEDERRVVEVLERSRPPAADE